MSIRTVLDDAAALATSDLRIDLDQVHRQAHRSAVRRRATVAVTTVAVAAVVSLFAVLLPGRILRSAPVPPAGSTTRLGLPEHWYQVPPWTPPVTRRPMAAASMVLAAPIATGWGRETIVTPVLVSADGRTYASLPAWTSRDGEVALAADGRNVAWVTKGPGRPVVHRIRLSDGRRSDVTMPGRARINRLFWQGDRLLIQMWGKPAVWPAFGLAAGSETLQSEKNPPKGLVDNPFSAFELPGDFLMSATANGDFPPGRTAFPTDRLLDGSRLGSRAVTSLEIKDGRHVISRPVQPIDGRTVTGAGVMSVGRVGFVVRYQDGKPFVDYGSQQSGTRFEVYRWDGTEIGRITGVRGSYPTAVAWDLAVAPPVAVRPPAFSGTDRSHLRFLAVQGWTVFGVWFWPGVLLALAAVGAVLLVRRRAPVRTVDRGSESHDPDRS